MSSQQTFAVEVPVHDSEAMDEFQKAMDAHAEAVNKYIDEIAQKLEVSDSCAMDIYYLRSRSRWTQEAEDELIRRDQAGEPRPNICEWPKTCEVPGTAQCNNMATVSVVVGGQKTSACKSCRDFWTGQ